MLRPILAIFGFGAVATLVATAALDWAAEPRSFSRPALSFQVSLSVTL